MNNLRKLRLQKGLSIKELSEKIGLASCYLSQLETGKRPLNNKTLKAFCEFYKVKPNELLGYDNMVEIDENDNYFNEMGISELKALTPNDIIGNELSITKRLEVKAKVKGITTLKTASSNRRVLMPSAIIDKIKTITNDGLIFPTSETQIRRKLDEYIKKSGVKKIRLHDFRHSHASFLINSGCSIRLVSERLGHSSPSITMDYYWHLLPNEQEKIIDFIEKEKKV